MSLFTQGSNAKKSGARKAGPDQGGQLPATAQTALGAEVQRVLEFIPSDVISVYVGITGVIQPVSDRAKWEIYTLGCLFIPLFLWLGSGTTNVGNRASNPRWRLVNLTWMGFFAFSAWVAALPETPFLVCNEHANQYGTAAMIVLAAILPRLATRLDLV